MHCTAANCVPSRYSLLTGRISPPHLGSVDKNVTTLTGMRRFPSFVSVLKEAGWRTAFVGKWHLSGEQCPTKVACQEGQAVPADTRRGFDVWLQDLCAGSGTSLSSSPRPWYHSACLLRPDLPALQPPPGTYEPTFYTDVALEQLELLSHSEGQSPFFLMLSLRPPHAPFLESAPGVDGLVVSEVRAKMERAKSLASSEYLYGATSYVSGYFGSVQRLDFEFGRILNASDAIAQTRERLVVFTSGHGWALGERNSNVYGKS